MPSKTRKPKAALVLPTIPKELIDQFVNGPMSAEAVNAASMAFKKALIERALGAELTHHLGYAAGADKPAEGKNHRNGALQARYPGVVTAIAPGGSQAVADWDEAALGHARFGQSIVRFEVERAPL